MNVHIALFFHICGVLMLFGAAALEITSVNRMGRASSVEVARAWAGVNKPLEFVFPIAAVLLIITGLYMLHESSDFNNAAQPWALTVLVVLIVLAVFGAGFNGPRIKAITRALESAPDGRIPTEVESRIHDPYLLTSMHTLTSAILGAVLIMTVKPGLRDSIIIIAVFMILGLAGTHGMLRSSAQRGSAESGAVAVEAER